MPTHDDVMREVWRFACERNAWILPSGLYSLFPNKRSSCKIAPSHAWPDPWPNAACHGIYVFFADGTEPELLYIGKTSGRTSSIKARLNGYVDSREYRTTGQCVLRGEWNGQQRPWTIEPRFIMSIGLETETSSGRCPLAEELEAYLINCLAPAGNTAAPKKR